MAWIANALKRLRDERATAAGFALLVLVTALMATAAPRLLGRVADDTLRAELGLRPAAARNVQLVRQDRLNEGSQGDPPLAGVQADADVVDGTLPDEVRGLISERALVVDSIRWHVTSPTGDPSFVRLRIQPGAESRFHLVAGRLPSATTRTFTDRDEQPAEALEVALSSANAKALQAGVGDTVTLDGDTSDPLARGLPSTQLEIDVVGIFEVDNPDDPWWLGDSSMDHPSIRGLGGDAFVLDMLAFLVPEEYPALLGVAETAHPALRYTYRDYVDSNRIRERDLPTLIPAFRKLEARYPNANVPLGGGVALRTSIRPFLELQQRRWAAASAVLLVAAVGPAAVAAGALGMVAVLAARRRRSALSLSRGRGASIEQVTIATIAEGLLIAAPATAIGAVIGIAAAPEDPIRLAVLTAVGVAVAAISVLVVATVPATGGPAFGSGREVSVPRRPTARRLVFEGLVIVIAVGGAFLLRERGLRATGPITAVGVADTTTIATTDPLIAAVPALVGLAAGLIAIRLIGLPTGLLGRLARFGRGLVPLVAMRRASSGGGGPILLVLLATTAIGAFSSSGLQYLDTSADAAAWRDVGADFRVASSQGPLRPGFDFAAIPGVQAAATMFRGTATIAGHGAQGDLAVLDVEAFEQVVKGTPAEADLPIDFYGPANQPLPVVISSVLANRAGGVKLGETVQVSVEGYTFDAKAIAVRDSFPGVADAIQFIVVSGKQLRTLFPDAPLRPTVAFLRADASAEPAIRSAVTAVMTQATITGRVERSVAISDAPIVHAVRLGIGAAAVVAGLYAALAVAAALALAGAARSAEAAHLRTLGLSRRQELLMLILEHGPALTLAFLGGLGLGVGLLAILLPGLGLQTLVGVDVPVSPGLDPLLALAMAAGLVAISVIGLLLGLFLERRAVEVAALRRGFE